MARFEDNAEDLNDPADTYRVQDACANYAHVFIRREYDNPDELFCAFRAPPRPHCMSLFMGELVEDSGAPWGEDADGQKQWDAWKNARLAVVQQGICGELTLKPATDKEST